MTLGPPFLEKGVTEFRASATRSKVFERPFGSADYLEPAAEFDWPDAPRPGGGTADLRRSSPAAASSAYTAHLMDPPQDTAFFVAFSPAARLMFGYVWRRADFPWMGIWEENASRPQPPWKGVTLTRGMEFGVSPFPETRREMIERGRLFGVPTFRWIPAATRVTVDYAIVIQPGGRGPGNARLAALVLNQKRSQLFEESSTMFLSSLASGLVSLVLLSAPVAPVVPAAAQDKPASSARTVEITGGDDMKYSVTSIPAKPGETLRIRLMSKGTLPKIAMAHNVVLLKLAPSRSTSPTPPPWLPRPATFRPT